jgi:hypothetical protein
MSNLAPTQIYNFLDGTTLTSEIQGDQTVNGDLFVNGSAYISGPINGNLTGNVTGNVTGSVSGPTGTFNYFYGNTGTINYLLLNHLTGNSGTFNYLKANQSGVTNLTAKDSLFENVQVTGELIVDGKPVKGDNASKWNEDEEDSFLYPVAYLPDYIKTETSNVSSGSYLNLYKLDNVTEITFNDDINNGTTYNLCTVNIDLERMTLPLNKIKVLSTNSFNGPTQLLIYGSNSSTDFNKITPWVSTPANLITTINISISNTEQAYSFANTTVYRYYNILIRKPRDYVYPDIKIKRINLFCGTTQIPLVYPKNINARIGINTSTPSTNLEVNGDVRAKNLTLTENLVVNGTINYVNTTDLNVADPLIICANNNAFDTLDTGLIAKYNGSSYGGLVRKAGGNYELNNNITTITGSTNGTPANLQVKNLTATESIAGLTGTFANVNVSGNVGIGVSPSTKLDIYESDLTLRNNSTIASRKTPRYLRTYDTGSSTAIAQIGLLGTETNGYKGAITFETKNADVFNSSLTERARIDASGLTVNGIVSGQTGIFSTVSASNYVGLPTISGPTGPTGAQGIQGIQGPTGPTGPQGIQGIAGPTGTSYWGLSGTTLFYNSGNVSVNNSVLVNTSVVAKNEVVGETMLSAYKDIDFSNIMSSGGTPSTKTLSITATTTVTKPLTISGATGPMLNVLSSASSEPLALLQSSGDASIRVNGQGGESYCEFVNSSVSTNAWKVGLNDSSRLDINYGAQGTMNSTIEAMSITNTGSVGISNTNPQAKLHLSGGTKATSFNTGAPGGDFIIEEKGTSGNKEDATLAFWATDSTGSVTSYGAGRIKTGWETATSTAWNQSAITFQTHGNNNASYTNDMTIRGGNVSIGGTGPASKLEVYEGDIYLRNTAGYPSRTVPRYIGVYDSGSTTELSRIGFAGTTGPTGTNGYQGHITFQTKTTDAFNAAITEKMRLSSAGNLGIGLTGGFDATEKLEVNGNMKLTGDLIINTSSTPGLGYMRPYNFLRIKVKGTTANSRYTDVTSGVAPNTTTVRYLHLTDSDNSNTLNVVSSLNLPTVVSPYLISGSPHRLRYSSDPNYVVGFPCEIIIKGYIEYLTSGGQPQIIPKAVSYANMTTSLNLLTNFATRLTRWDFSVAPANTSPANYSKFVQDSMDFCDYSSGGFSIYTTNNSISSWEFDVIAKFVL